MPSRTRMLARLPDVLPVGVGLLLLGVSSYVVLGVAGHALSARDYAALGSLYLMVAIVGPGVSFAVEQVANREVSARLAVGSGTGQAIRAGGAAAALLAAVVCAALLALSPWLVPGVLGGSWSLLGAALVAVVGSAAVYLLRGIFAGEGRYGWYATSLGAEGLVRILPCLLVAVVGGAGLAAFGFMFALGAGIAAVVCLPGLRAWPAGSAQPGPPLAVRPVAVATGMLALATGLTFLVANLAPLVLTWRLPDQPEIAASFVSLFVLARIPLFLFAPLQAFLLPSLTAGVQRGDAAHVRSRLRVAVLAVAAVGVPGVLLAAALGPWAARVLFNAPVQLPALAAGLLGLSTVAMMAAQLLQPALVALGAHRRATVAWVSGTVVFAVLVLLPGDPVAAAVAAQLAGPLVVVVVMVVAIRSGLARLAQDGEMRTVHG